MVPVDKSYGFGASDAFFDRSIDLVIATHADADHIGGFGPIFQRFEVLGALDNGLSEEADDYRSYDQGQKRTSRKIGCPKWSDY